MCIEVTNHDGVVREVEKGVKVRGVCGRAGGVRREVEVDDIQVTPAYGHPDTINLQGAVRKVVEVKVGEGDVVRDEEGYTSTRPARAVLSDEGIAGEVFRIGFVGKFSFLEANDGDFEGEDEEVEFV